MGSKETVFKQSFGVESGWLYRQAWAGNCPEEEDEFQWVDIVSSNNNHGRNKTQTS